MFKLWHCFWQDTSEKVKKKQLNDLKWEHEALEQKFSKVKWNVILIHTHPGREPYDLCKFVYLCVGVNVLASASTHAHVLLCTCNAASAGKGPAVWEILSEYSEDAAESECEERAAGKAARHSDRPSGEDTGSAEFGAFCI